MTVYIVLNEDTSEILGAFDNKSKALKCIAFNNSSKDNLVLVPKIVF